MRAVRSDENVWVKHPGRQRHSLAFGYIQICYRAGESLGGHSYRFRQGGMGMDSESYVIGITAHFDR